MKLAETIELLDLSMSKRARSTSTRVGYAFTIRNLQKFLGDDIELKEISTCQVHQWLIEVERKKPSSYTLYGNARRTQLFSNWCTENDYLEISPAAQLELPIPLLSWKLPQAGGYENLERMLNVGSKLTSDAQPLSRRVARQSSQ